MTSDNEHNFQEYHRYYSLLLTHAAGILGNNHDAEDVMQDLALKIIEHEDFFQNVHNRKAYLFETVHNLSLDLYRKNKRRDNTTTELVPNTLPGISESGYHRFEDRDLIHRLLEHCSSDIRSVIIRFAFHGHKISEIAEDLGVSPNSLSKRIRRALHKIRKRHSRHS